MPLDPTDAAVTPQPVGPVNPDAVTMAQPPTGGTGPVPTSPVEAPDVSTGAPSGGTLTGRPAPPPRAGLRTGLRQGFMGQKYRVTGTGEIESGETTAPTFTSRLGTILGTIAMGALGGLGGVEKGNRSGAVGAGFRSANELIQRRDLMRRQQAQQQFENKQKVQTANDEHLYRLAELHKMDLDNIKTIYELNKEKEEDPERLAQLKLVTQNVALELEKNEKALGLEKIGQYRQWDVPKNIRDAVANPSNLTYKVSPQADGSYIIYKRKFDPTTTDTTEDFTVKNVVGWDDKKKEPIWSEPTTIKAGQAKMNVMEAELDKQRKQNTDARMQHLTAA